MEYHSALTPLSWLFGTWESIEAEVFYPTMETVKYTEILDIQPTQQPLLDYKSDTWHLVKKNKMHCERGFLKVHPEDGKVSLLIAHNFGLAEVSEGTLDKGKKELSFESKSVFGTSCTNVPATKKLVRQLKLEGDELHVSVLMETVSQPLQKHLQVRYKKKN